MSRFQNIKSKYGVYGIWGNHDHFDGRIQTEVELVRSVGFHMLVDEAVDLPCHIHLVGLEDYRKRTAQSVLGKTGGRRSRKSKFAAGTPAPAFLGSGEGRLPDLYMAGHTPGGQQATG